MDMDKLSPRARAMLDLAGDAHDPTPEQRVRADAAVRIGLALHGVTDLPPLDRPASALHAAKPASISKLGWTSGWKLGVGAATLLAAGVFAARGAHRPPPVELPRAPVQLTAPSAVLAAPLAPLATALPAAPALDSSKLARIAPHAGTARAPLTLASVRGVRHPRSLGVIAPARRGGATVSVIAPARRGGATMPRSTGDALIEPEASLEVEVQLIGSANELIRARRFEDALRVLASHAQRFPRGALREERAALHVLALCGLDSGDRTQRELQRFLRGAPRSVMAQRVRASCAASEGALP